jgi:hypothetical protein
MFAFIERLNGGEMIAVIAILSGAGVVALGILVSGWNSATNARQQADLKRDMLARGLSVQEIEQLTMSETARQAQQEYDHRIREAQVGADLKRDLVARGMPIEQVAHVTAASGADVGVLAETICALAEAGTLDRKAVARLIETFLKRGEIHVTAARKATEGNHAL